MEFDNTLWFFCLLLGKPQDASIQVSGDHKQLNTYQYLYGRQPSATAHLVRNPFLRLDIQLSGRWPVKLTHGNVY